MKQRGSPGKRLLSLLLVMVMVFGLMPTSVFAADPTTKLSGLEFDAQNWSDEDKNFYLIDKTTGTGQVYLQAKNDNVDYTVSLKFNNFALDYRYLIPNNKITIPLTVTTEGGVSLEGDVVSVGVSHSVKINGTKKDTVLTSTPSSQSENFSADVVVDENGTLSFTVEVTCSFTCTSSDIDISSATFTRKIVIKKFETEKVPAYPEYNVTFYRNYPNDKTTGTNVAYSTEAVYASNTGVSNPGQPAAPDGYMFAGWYTTADCTASFDFGKKIEDDTSVYAKWTQVSASTKTYTVKFYRNYKADTGADVAYSTETVYEGNIGMSNPGQPPAEDGYVFTGWYTAKSGGTLFSFDTAITENKTVYAQWTEASASTEMYNVTFIRNYPDDVESAVVYSIETVYENNIGVSNPGQPVAPAGYVFDDWCENSGGTVLFNFNKEITGATKVYARWTKTYTVTYYANGADVYNMPAVNPQTVTAGTALTKPAIDPARDGYTFGGWYTDAACTDANAYTFGSTLAADVTLYAKWTKEPEAKTYTVTYYANGADVYNMPAVNPQTVAADTVLTEPALKPARDGYTFGGWYTDAACTDANAYTFGSTLAADVTLYARWTKEPEAKTYTVTYYANGANVYNMPVTNPQTVTEGTTLSKPAPDPAREGYTFKDWYTNAACTSAYTFGSEVDADVTLYAGWAKETVYVSFSAIADGAGVSYKSGANNSPVVKGTDVNFSLTLAEGYDPATLTVKANGVPLSPASTDGNVYSYVFTANAATTVTVNAPAKLSYTVTMPVGHFTAAITQVDDADVNKASASVTYGGSYKFKIEPAKGYSVAVYVNGEQLTAGAGNVYSVDNVKGPQTIEVVESESRYYTVTYVLPTVSGQYAQQTVTEGDTASAPVAPSPEGYTFDGWYTAGEYAKDNGTVFDFASVITEDITLYGKLTAKTYTITYNKNCNDDSVTAPSAASKTHGIAILLSDTALVREGYTFLGWSTVKNAAAAAYQPGDPYSVDESVTLYAVWQKQTFTVTLPSGTGYSISTEQGTTVEYGDSFTFNVIVDSSYTEKEPTVKVGTLVLKNPEAVSVGASRSYTYTIENITSNKVVSVQVEPNQIYTVRFVLANGAVYQTQLVGYGERVALPVDPVVDGYKFGGWYKTEACEDGSEWNFVDVVTEDPTPQTTPADVVTGNTSLYAKLTPVKPAVSWSTEQTGYALTFTQPAALQNVTDTTAIGSASIAYGDAVTFTITVKDGYDATNMQVGFNGVLLAPTSIDDSKYTYTVPAVRERSNTITVVGVVRRTVTVTYMSNALDDVSGMPTPQTVQYPLADSWDKLTAQEPKRIGYTFLGWSTDSERNPLEFDSVDKGYAAADFKAGEKAVFTQDTTLYAVWQADELFVTISIGGEYCEADSTTTKLGTKLDYAYEGDEITLTGTLSMSAQGTMTFYRVVQGKTNWEQIGTVSINGGAVGTLGTVVPDYDSNTHRYDYKVVFVPTSGEGYQACESTDDLRVYSKAISWTRNESGTAVNALTIYESLGEDPVETMTAGKAYYLQIPSVVELDGGRQLKLGDGAQVLSAAEHYEVIWEYQTGTNSWTQYSKVTDSDWVMVTPEYSGYAFRAKVTPVQSSIYTKAADFDDDYKLVNNKYEDYLYTKPTADTGLRETETELEIIGADKEADGIVGIEGEHLAQYEKQEVTLVATVTTKTGKLPVTGGYVQFFRVKDDTLEVLNRTLVSVDGTGRAELTVTLSEYEKDKAAAANFDEFYAVYMPNAAYTRSESSKVKVYIKSSAISWALTDEFKIAEAADVVGIYTDPDCEEAVDSMTANGTYYLKLPTVSSLDGRKELTCNTDYTVQWQYLDTTTNSWQTCTFLAAEDVVKIDPQYSAYTYRAVVRPTDKARSSFDTAARYVGRALDTTQYAEYLVTAQTVKTNQQATDTVLGITGADTEAADVAGIAGEHLAQYEKQDVTLVATVTTDNDAPVTSGYVRFYRVKDGNPELLNETLVSVDETGKAELKVTLSDYAKDKTAAENLDAFYAVYQPNATYAGSQSSTDPAEKVYIKSAAISWDLTDESEIAENADVVGIYTDEACHNAADSMTANNTYYLKLPEVISLDDRTKLTCNTDYTVEWQYLDTTTDSWKKCTFLAAEDVVKIDPEYSGYTYRAVVRPADKARSSFDTAARYVGRALDTTQYAEYLVTANTVLTERQNTSTALTIEGAQNEGTIQVFGEDKFDAEHLVQYEGQTVTLKAAVTEATDAKTPVKTGVVYFYRWVDGTNDELLNPNSEGISIGNDGIATMTYTIPDYVAEKSIDAEENCSRIYAVYAQNETWNTSASVAKADEAYSEPVTLLADVVYTCSAKIHTPVIESSVSGKIADNEAYATTYESDLTELPTGEKITFTLRTGNAAADYSVVALDGREIEAKDYDIQWMQKTGLNEETSTGGSNITYVLDQSKEGDTYRVKLTGKGVFADSEAYSKYACIGVKKDVLLTVTAKDAIEATEAVDVYQLGEITLTATVEPKDEKATMQPTGSVTFFYSTDNGESWTMLTDKSKNISEIELALVEGQMRASITTDRLPVADETNTCQNVIVSAIYSGDSTFNAVYAEDSEPSVPVAPAEEDNVSEQIVTVYSSVVYNCEDENRASAGNEKGIHISVKDGTFKVNEKVVLQLSDIYTLDRELNSESLLNKIAKLDYGTDYTVQWQKLDGEPAVTDGDYSSLATSYWSDLAGEVNQTLVLTKVEQNTAYRAVITVKDTAIARGSFTEVDQGTIGTKDANDGRKVYYSNVLVPSQGNATISVAINTGDSGTNEEGITEGETVSVNVLVSGAVNAVPEVELTATVTNDADKGNDNAYEKTLDGKNTVNGWNVLTWDTADAQPGYYTLTVTGKSNTGYEQETITRSLIVRESSYDIAVGNQSVAYNGQTQGVTVELEDFHFNGSNIDAAAAKSWTVKYYDKDNNLVEPSQAGTYTAVVTLSASAYWTEMTREVTFTIRQREVSIADAVAQAKIYDGTTDVNIVEVVLNDAVTDQTATGLPTGETGIINGDSIYAVATKAALNAADAGNEQFTISAIALKGDDAQNYKWDAESYSEEIYVSRSQVYGEVSADVVLKTGSELPVDAVYMIDQSGVKITDYDVTYYLHTDTEIRKVSSTNVEGLYTVIARPAQKNYKGGVTMKIRVAAEADSYVPASAPQPSTLITISNTAELYGAATGAVATNTSGEKVTVEYQNGTDWSTAIPANAGRYLVRATDETTGDVAYGIYTITKAHPTISIAAEDATYNSMPYDSNNVTMTKEASSESYLTYAGDVAIGYDIPADGNVAEEAPVNAGEYVVTLHVNETLNYTAHEVSASFTIEKKALTVTADSWASTQYDAFPTMTATYTGLAAEEGDTTPDTSLRDVQIAPEFLFNPTNGASDYSNDALDQVGTYVIQPIDALSSNYAITYKNGEYTRQNTNINPDLAIHGLPQSSTGKTTVYYGDVIQLYPYGYYEHLANGSSQLKWSVSDGAPATIDQKGILTITGVGEFTVTLTRGEGEQQISTTVSVTAIKQELYVHVAEQDKVYNGAAQNYDGAVKAYDKLYVVVKAATTTPANRTRENVGTQITTSRIANGSVYYQSRVYGGQFTINDKEDTVAPTAQTTVYGTTETFDNSPVYTVTDADAISNVKAVSQTDCSNRLDIHDGYEILVAGTENMNYNVSYTTDQTAEDSAVTEYVGVKFTSKTVKELNDATVYGETPNVLDWTLENAQSTKRGAKTYADNLADFNLPEIFVKQDKDDCTGNAKTYKAANRTTQTGTIAYNQNVLSADRTAEDTGADENYTLKFTKSVTNSGAENYKLTDAEVGNATTTTDALTAGSKGFITADGESGVETGENFIEGSANIAQRPVKVTKKATADEAALYWKLPQKDLHTALLNILEAEENSVNRGLAKGHSIEDLDLSFSIGGVDIEPDTEAVFSGPISTTGATTVTLKIGDTNYVLDGSETFDVNFETLRIRATYYSKTFTGFKVKIEKIDSEGESAGALTSANGLTFKVFKQVNGVVDESVDYAANKTFKYVSSDDKYGYFVASYSKLPQLGSGELYVFQLYEYGVALDRK